MKLLIFMLILVLHGSLTFDKKLFKLGNLVRSMGSHLFSRFTDTGMPSGEDGNLCEQMEYIYTIIKKYKTRVDEAVSEHDKDLHRAFIRTFVIQIKPALDSVSATDEELKSTYNLTNEESVKFRDMVTNTSQIIDQIIELQKYDTFTDYPDEAETYPTATRRF